MQQQRIIEAHFLAQALDGLFGRPCAEGHTRRIARQDAAEQEDENAEAEQDKNGLKDASQQKEEEALKLLNIKEIHGLSFSLTFLPGRGGRGVAPRPP